MMRISVFLAILAILSACGPEIVGAQSYATGKYGTSFSGAVYPAPSSSPFPMNCVTGCSASTGGIAVYPSPGAPAFPVSAASLPLPSGAATSAKQPALGTAGSASSDVLTVQGATSMTALKVDGSAVAQPVVPVITATQTTYVAGSTTTTGTQVKGSAGVLAGIINTSLTGQSNPYTCYNGTTSSGNPLWSGPLLGSQVLPIGIYASSGIFCAPTTGSTNSGNGINVIWY